MGNIFGYVQNINSDSSEIIVKPVNSFGQNALMLAINNKDEALVKNLLNNNKYLDEQDNYGWTPIVYGIHNANIMIIKLILEKNPNMNILTNNKLSPLDHAKITRNQEIIQLIKK